MHQPALTKDTKADRATFDDDYTFHSRGTARPCFSVAAEGIDPARQTAHALLLINERAATIAAEHLLRAVIEFRLARA